MIRRLIAPLTFVALALHAGQAFAQGTFPAPLPGQTAPSTASPFPPVNGAAPAAAVGGPSPLPATGAAPITGSAFVRPPAPPSQAGGPPDDCMKKFMPLREEAEKRGKLIKAAGDSKAGPEEACKLIGDFRQSEIKMIKYVEANAARCGIPLQVADQMKTGHKNTENMQKKVCAAAQQRHRKGPTGDFVPLPVAVTW